jgi:hypothetical protein
MRTFLLLAFLLPLFAGAQINRSARELAGENIQEYISKKLFKDQPYKSVFYGDLKAYVEKKQDIAWTVEHKFEVTEGEMSDKKATHQQTYKFLFYLNDKMEVKKAESYYVY